MAGHPPQLGIRGLGSGRIPQGSDSILQAAYAVLHHDAKVPAAHRLRRGDLPAVGPHHKLMAAQHLRACVCVCSTCGGKGGKGGNVSCTRLEGLLQANFLDAWRSRAPVARLHLDPGSRQWWSGVAGFSGGCAVCFGDSQPAVVVSTRQAPLPAAAAVAAVLLHPRPHRMHLQLQFLEDVLW